MQCVDPNLHTLMSFGSVSLELLSAYAEFGSGHRIVSIALVPGPVKIQGPPKNLRGPSTLLVLFYTQTKP